MSKQSNLSTQDDILVSVIIPTFGRRERLQYLLSQLFAQDVSGFGYEIIVVDDGSPAPVGPSVERLSQNNDVTVRCLRKENGGPASARNFGAQAARGQFLLFVDDDMSVRPDFVRAHVETQLAFGPALVNCQFDWRIEASSPPFQRWYRQRVAEWTRFRVEDAKQIAEDVFEVTNVLATTANLSVSRKHFDSAGGFDDGYPFGCEDQDFAGRLSRDGVRALATTKSIATHVETHNSLKRICQRQRLGAMDTVRFIRRFAVDHHCGEQAIAAANGPIRLKTDSFSLIAKKILRQFVASRALSPSAFACVYMLERVMPESSLLNKLYDMLVSAYTQKGWREGLKTYNAEPPLKEWAPTTK